MKEIPNLKKLVMKKAVSPQIGQYEWDAIVAPGLGYSFSEIHALEYSYIGFQSAYLATHWNPVYWNTACLIVNSESLEQGEDEEYDNIVKTEKSSDYAKIAKALGDTISRGIKVSLININESDFTFKPDAKNNRILFGLKGLPKINKDTIDLIKSGRPYSGIKDFMKKCKINKAAMISLIKSGAFDELDRDWAIQINPEPRIGIMAYYLSQVSELKKKLTLQNLSGLIQYSVLPEELLPQTSTFLVNKDFKKRKIANDYYERYNGYDLLSDLYFEDLKYEIEIVNDKEVIKQKTWDKFYNSQMDIIRNWIKENHDDALIKLNSQIFKENWEKYASGTISAWEMEALCFYYHPHELKDVNYKLYGIKEYKKLPETPVISLYYKKTIPIYDITKIIGTVIAKNDTRHTISLLTPESGVVNVKFTKDYYAMFKGQLSEIQENGKKSVIEKGWFTRGNLLMVSGYRREDTFVAKTYKRLNSHTLYKITKVENGKIELVNERGK